MFAETFGADALVSRYGGDEFLAAVRSKDLQGLFEKAEKLRLSIEKERPEISVGGETIRTGFTITMGLATYPLHASDSSELIEKAIKAMYRAKEAGGNRVCFYEEKDVLTGLLNYYGGMSALEEELAKGNQKRDNLSIIMMDIDRFKEINDEFGHRAGDEVLKRLAHILTRNFKDVGITARTKGDEFMVILPAHRADSAFILAEEVRKVIEDSPIKLGIGDRSLSLHFQITGGVATYPSDGTERTDLLRKADEALYRGKRTGRNRICLPTSAQMVTKTSHYTQIQLERLGEFSRKLERSEAFLLREALDDLLRKYSDEGGA
jgi:diguanylate cyclase (GGDEF)-like protein